MFVTTLEHDGQTWDVEMSVVHDAGPRGRIDFRFTPRGDSLEDAHCLTWSVSAETFALHAQRGVDLGEDVLRERLAIIRTER